MLDPIQICSNALILLGGQSISSFNDGSAGSEIAGMLFDSVYHALLTETRWHFATRTARLPRLYETPDNDYLYKFQLPEDNLYVIKCSSNPYEIYEDQLYCNADDIQIEYIFAPKVDKLPAYFVKVLEYRLAAEFAIPLASDDKRTTLYYGMYQQELRKAKYNDASSRTNTKIEDKPYITARFQG